MGELFGGDTDAVIPPNSKLKAELIVFENETSPLQLFNARARFRE